jgi:predicted unusual protein kinase regulating ubiquinone biosynthesis (AarF/ABC1/UbiB family)
LASKKKSETPLTDDDSLILGDLIPVLRQRTVRLARATGDYTLGVAKILKSLLPLTDLLNRRERISEEQLHEAINQLFASLVGHPLTGQLRGLTARMRAGNLLPNEQSTEELIRFLVDQATARSVITIPTEITDEFWNFFNELLADPELKGIGEVSLDVLRIVLTAYEPLLVQLINQLKDLRQLNDDKLREIVRGAEVLRGDLVIFRRQIRALRGIRLFFATDPEDLVAQAEVVAQMVREFGPLFIKMAQVAAANSGFLPEEMSDALEVFQQDVDPMTPAEVEAAFLECFGETPGDRYFGFDASKPLKSGSIASVFLARKPLDTGSDKPQLHPVVVKVGRHNLAREFVMGKTVIKLAILSSHYWAPHSKLAPFFNSWLDQIDEFVEGFERELDFDAEARNQAHFARRAKYFDSWNVPQVYCSSRRIIEMEFVAGGASLNSAFAGMSRRRSRKMRRRAGRKFLHAVFSHLLIYREFHGDLHPGNVLLTPAGELHFVDWGNTVDVNPIWKPAVQYMQAVLSGNTDAVTESLTAMCTEPNLSAQRRTELAAIVAKTFDDADVTPLGIDFALTLYREGLEGLMRRADLAINLGSAISRQGITIKGEYLHLARSVSAMLGSLGGLYKGLPTADLVRDCIRMVVLLPTHLGVEYVNGQRNRMLRNIARSMPASLRGVSQIDRYM